MSKICTDLNQSQTLAEILSHESADMCYLHENGQAKTVSPSKLSEILNVSKPQVIPCWSLAALLEIIRKEIFLYLITDDRGYSCHGRDKGGELYVTTWHDTPIDAAYEMIVWLLENKKL